MLFFRPLTERKIAWRKILKDLILFFKELQKSYETRSKLFLSASNILNSAALPPSFLDSGGLADATDILRDFHHQGHMEANKACLLYTSDAADESLPV